MSGRRALAAALALAPALAAAPALAQPRSSNRPPQEIAGELVKQAISKSQTGEHLAAIDLYLQAYSLIPQHTLLSNVGNEYLEAGKPIEALKYFCMYLDKDPTGTNATYATSKAKTIQIELGNKDVDDQTVCKPPRKEREPKDREPGDGTPGEDGTTGTRDLGKARPAHGAQAGGKPGRTLELAGVVTGAVGLVGVAVGTYYGAKARDRSDFISNHNPAEPWPDNLAQIEAEGQAFEDRQIGFTIAGGALTATGVVLFILGATRTGPEQPASGGAPDPRDRSVKPDEDEPAETSARRAARPRWTLRPALSPGGVGLALGGGF